MMTLPFDEANMVTLMKDVSNGMLDNLSDPSINQTIEDAYLVVMHSNLAGADSDTIPLQLDIRPYRFSGCHLMLLAECHQTRLVD